MVSFPKRSLLSLSLVVLLAIVLVPAHAQPDTQASQDPVASLAKRHATHDHGQVKDYVRGHPFDKRSPVEEIPGDLRVTRPKPWKRTLIDSEDPRHETKFARPMAWKRSLADSEDPRHETKFARPMAWKRSLADSEDPRHETKFARPMAWKRSLADSEDPRHETKFARPMAWKRDEELRQGRKFARPMAWKTKRAVGTVPDSSAVALDSLKPMRRAAVFEKRAVGAVDVSGAKESTENAHRLVTRDTISQAGQVEAIRAD